MEKSENREEKALVFAPNTLSLGCSLQSWWNLGSYIRGDAIFSLVTRPLLKGGGNVGGEYPSERVFDFFVRMFRGRGVFTCNEAYKF